MSAIERIDILERIQHSSILHATFRPTRWVEVAQVVHDARMNSQRVEECPALREQLGREVGGILCALIVASGTYRFAQDRAPATWALRIARCHERRASGHGSAKFLRGNFSRSATCHRLSPCKRQSACKPTFRAVAAFEASLLAKPEKYTRNWSGGTIQAMLIALDYDGTYTADPIFWDTFIASAQSHGHGVACITMRHEASESLAVLADMEAPPYPGGVHRAPGQAGVRRGPGYLP